MVGQKDFVSYGVSSTRSPGRRFWRVFGFWRSSLRTDRALRSGLQRSRSACVREA